MRASSAPASTQNAWDAQPDATQLRPTPLVDPSYGEMKRFIENEIALAEQDLKKAQLSFVSAKRKVARGLEPARLPAGTDDRQGARAFIAGVTLATVRPVRCRGHAYR